MGGDDLAGIFLDEGLEIHEAITECLDQWREDPDELTILTRLQQELHTLKGGARLSDIDPVADLAEAWSDSLEPLLSGGNNQQALLALSDQGAASLKGMLDSLEDGHKPAAASDLIEAFRSVQAEPAEQGEQATATAEPAADEADAVDPEVLEIFLEEAGEIMDQLEQVLDDWRKDPSNHQYNQEAQRALHTLKGGARLSQLSVLGDKAHALETRLIDLGGNAPGDSQWQEITRDHDAIIELVSDVRRRFADGSPVIQPEQPLDATPEHEQPEPQAAERETPVPEAPKPPAPAKPAQARPGPATKQRKPSVLPRKPSGYRHRCWTSWLTWPVKPVLPVAAWNSRPATSATPLRKWPLPSSVCANSCAGWISKPKPRSCSVPSRNTARITATTSTRWKWTATPRSSSCHGH